MSYETELNIALKVTDGPAIAAQKTKSPKEYWNPEYYCSSMITEVQSKRVVIECPPKPLSNVIHFPDFSDMAKYPEYFEKQLGFVAISADKMFFKDTCGRDQPGIFYWSDTYPHAKEVLDGPHIYLNRQLQPLDMKTLTFDVCSEMFACIKEPDKKKVTITVTFGIASKVETCGGCEPCSATSNGKYQPEEKGGEVRSKTRTPSYA